MCIVPNKDVLQNEIVGGERLDEIAPRLRAVPRHHEGPGCEDRRLS